MKLSEVLEHMGERGAVRRGSWHPDSLLVFGMDNVGWLYIRHPYTGSKSMWVPFLAEILADDWEIVDLNWERDREEFDGPGNYYKGEANG